MLIDPFKSYTFNCPYDLLHLKFLSYIRSKGPFLIKENKSFMICTYPLFTIPADAPKQSVSTFIIGMASLHGAITSPNAGESACSPLIDNQSHKLLTPRYQRRDDVVRLTNKKVKISSLRETLGCVKAVTPQIKGKVLPLKPHQQNTLQREKKKSWLVCVFFFF